MVEPAEVESNGRKDIEALRADVLYVLSQSDADRRFSAAVAVLAHLPPVAPDELLDAASKQMRAACDDALRLMIDSKGGTRAMAARCTEQLRPRTAAAGLLLPGDGAASAGGAAPMPGVVDLSTWRRPLVAVGLTIAAVVASLTLLPSDVVNDTSDDAAMSTPERASGATAVTITGTGNAGGATSADSPARGTKDQSSTTTLPTTTLPTTTLPLSTLPETTAAGPAVSAAERALDRDTTETSAAAPPATAASASTPGTAPPTTVAPAATPPSTATPAPVAPTTAPPAAAPTMTNPPTTVVSPERAARNAEPSRSNDRDNDRDRTATTATATTGTATTTATTGTTTTGTTTTGTVVTGSATTWSETTTDLVLVSLRRRGSPSGDWPLPRVLTAPGAP